MIVEKVQEQAHFRRSKTPSSAITQRLEEAVELAARVAGPGTVVLLSPGGTSYDAYRDFEERGEHFRRLVTAVTEHSPDGKRRRPMSERVKPAGRYDWSLVSVVTILLLLGVVMVFSASFPRGLEGFDNPFYFIRLPVDLAGGRRGGLGGDSAHSLHLLGPLEHPDHGDCLA